MVTRIGLFLSWENGICDLVTGDGKNVQNGNVINIWLYMTIWNITYFLGSKNVRKLFKQLVLVKFEHFYPDAACAGLVTISRLQDEFKHGGTLS